MTERADVVVVGAGILGAATAWSLARSGLRVTVLEAGRVNGQGSGATAGNLHIQGIHTRRPGQSTPVDVRRLLPLQHAAFHGWQRWDAELPAALGLRRTGGVMVAETADQVEDLEQKQGWEQAAGIPTEVLDRRAADRLMPGLGRSVLAATWCAWDGFADPASVTPALLGAAVAAGATVAERTPTTALQPSGGGWLVSAGDRRISCGQVVNVAGPWLDRVCALAGAAVAMSAVALQMWSAAPGPPLLHHLVQHVGEGLSVKQTADRRIVVGGGWPAGPLRPDGTADVLPASTEGSRGQLRRILPGIADLLADRVWTGPLAATPDEMPVVGEVPGCAGLFVAGGTYAFTFAPLWAQALTALITGSPVPVHLADLGPGRLMDRARPDDAAGLIDRVQQDVGEAR